MIKRFGFAALTFSLTLLGLAHASPPPPEALRAQEAALAQLDAEVAALADPEAKARRLEEAATGMLNPLEIFSRLAKVPSETSRAFFRGVLRDPSQGFGRNANYRQQAAWGLGQVGLPGDAAVLRKAAAEDPTTEAIGGCIVYEDNAREMAALALAELSKRFPQESLKGSWLQ